MISAAILSLALDGAVAATKPLPSYDHAIRCAALIDVAHARASDDKERDQLLDAGIFWGMAASEVARHDGIATFKADQATAKSKAEFDSTAHMPATAAELETCRAEVPPV